MVAGGAIFLLIAAGPCGVNRFPVEKSAEIPVRRTTDHNLLFRIHLEGVFQPGGVPVAELRNHGSKVDHHAFFRQRGWYGNCTYGRADANGPFRRKGERCPMGQIDLPQGCPGDFQRAGQQAELQCKDSPIPGRGQTNRDDVDGDPVFPFFQRKYLIESQIGGKFPPPVGECHFPQLIDGAVDSATEAIKLPRNQRLFGNHLIFDDPFCRPVVRKSGDHRFSFAEKTAFRTDEAPVDFAGRQNSGQKQRHKRGAEFMPHVQPFRV